MKLLRHHPDSPKLDRPDVSSVLRLLFSLFALSSFVPMIGTSQGSECTVYPGDMIITAPNIISDCGRMCWPSGMDSICINTTVSFTSTGATCAPANPGCSIEYMVLAFDPSGRQIPTVWGSATTVPFTFDQEGYWKVRMCSRDAATKQGLCETATSSIYVQINQPSISGPTLVCGQISAQYVISNPKSGFEYDWDFGPNASPRSASGSGPVTVRFNAEGLQTVTVTSSFGQHCSTTVSKTTRVELPEIYIGVDRRVCLNEEIELCAIKAPFTGSLLWSNGSNERCTKVTPDQAINHYSLTYSSPNGCTAVDHLTLYGDTCSKLGNYVWLDHGTPTIGANGIQDANENGMSGVNVVLYNKYNTALKVTKTDASGYYSFCTFPGDYYLKFSPPTGYLSTKPHSGGNDDIDSDVDNTYGSGTTGLINLGYRDTNMTIDYGVIEEGVLAIESLDFSGRFDPSTNLFFFEWDVLSDNDIKSLTILEMCDENQEYELKSLNAPQLRGSTSSFSECMENTHLFRLRITMEDDEVDYSQWIAIETRDNLGDPVLRVVPNPANDQLTVTLPTEEAQVLTVYNQQGQIIATYQNERGQSDIQIDAKDWPSGLYVLKSSFEGYAQMVLVR